MSKRSNRDDDAVGMPDAVEESKEERDITTSITSKKHKSDESLQQISAMSKEEEIDCTTLPSNQVIAKLREEIKRKDTENKNLKSENKKFKSENENLKSENKKLKTNTNTISLHAVMFGNGVPPLVNNGTNKSHMNTNHAVATMETKEFRLKNVINGLIKLLKQEEINLKSSPSYLMSAFLSSPQGLKTEVPVVKIKQQQIQSEADVVSYLNSALKDAVFICNVFIQENAETPATIEETSEKPNKETSEEPLELIVRQEMNIFSNRCDHAVVCDSTSYAPLICVETKKKFNKTFQTGEKNTVLGQCLDQLKAMQALGHPFPLGAITSFNETYMTCLSPDVDWDNPPNLEEIKKKLSQFHRTTTPPDETPPSLKYESSTDSTASSGSSVHACEFVPDEIRKIYRSENCIDQNSLVSALVVVILQALKGLYVPKKVKIYSKNESIHRDCLQLSSEKYNWGKLTTSFKGPLCQSGIPEDLYVLDYLGSGSTSRAYYAVTKEGWGCVIKMYVQSQHENGKLKTKEEFEDNSETHVYQEKENYTKIYGKELHDYVHVRVLNKLHCLVMPFFEPLSVTDRNNDDVLTAIERRLQQFANHQMAYNDCDINWCHVGRFDNKIYLFDLGDLVSCENIDVAQSYATDHLEVLKEGGHHVE